MKIEGVLTAIVTPFTQEGGLDLSALDRIVERQIEAGISGIVAAGTTGEGSSLSDEEREMLFLRVRDRVAGRALVIGGAGTNSLTSTLKYLEMVKECKLDAALVVTPYYNKPTPEGLVDFYSRCMRKVDVPLVLYNVPSRTACDLTPAVLAKLAGNHLLVGIKEATGDMGRAVEIHRDMGNKLSMLSGDDPTFLAMLACGGSGIVATTAHVDPEGMVGVFKAWRDGNEKKALYLQSGLMELYRTMFIESNPGPVKHALARMGLIKPVIRSPLVMPGRTASSRIDEVLTRAGFL
jgi:4-hydroxy-tetrahydrodipicolinate synthase